MALETNREKPFIHLTFLDAYTPHNDDYGNLDDYPGQKYYAEHYVDRTEDPIFCSIFNFIASTNTILLHAFNFDITNWDGTSDEKKDCGHQWPRYWYAKSITTPGYGYPLSFEGGNNQFDKLSTEYPPDEECKLFSKMSACLWKDIPITR